MSSESKTMPDGPKWYFSNSVLSQTPSIRKGWSTDKELKYRQKAAGFIQDMGERLNHNVKDTRARISQLCLSVAMIHMHRFYVFHPFQMFDPRVRPYVLDSVFTILDIAATALFLAAKLQECPRKLEHIVIVWHKLKYSDEPPLDPRNDNEKYHEASQLIVTLENILLQTIGFELEVIIPHTLILTGSQQHRASKNIVESAFWFASDILHMTTFCLRYKPSVVAAVCFHLTHSWAEGEAEIPKLADGRPFYYELDKSIKPELLQSMAQEFVHIRTVAADENRTKPMKSMTFLSRKNHPVKAGGSGTGSASPLPPPPQPPNINQTNIPNTSQSANNTPQSGMKRVKTEPISLDKYKEKRLKNQLNVSGNQSNVSASSSNALNVSGTTGTGGSSSGASARKSFMPDTSSDALYKEVLTKPQTHGSSGQPSHSGSQSSTSNHHASSRHHPSPDNSKLNHSKPKDYTTPRDYQKIDAKLASRHSNSVSGGLNEHRKRQHSSAELNSSISKRRPEDPSRFSSSSSHRHHSNHHREKEIGKKEGEQAHWSNQSVSKPTGPPPATGAGNNATVSYERRNGSYSSSSSIGSKHRMSSSSSTAYSSSSSSSHYKQSEGEPQNPETLETGNSYGRLPPPPPPPPGPAPTDSLEEGEVDSEDDNMPPLPPGPAPPIPPPPPS